MTTPPLAEPTEEEIKEGCRLVNTDFYNLWVTLDGRNIHRVGSPAVVWKDNSSFPGRLEWWRDGVLHREDGPALIIPGEGNEFFYIQGARVDESEYLRTYCIGKELNLEL